MKPTIIKDFTGDSWVLVDGVVTRVYDEPKPPEPSEEPQPLAEPIPE